jgi:hypothetical protein
VSRAQIERLDALLAVESAEEGKSHQSHVSTRCEEMTVLLYNDVERA